MSFATKSSIFSDAFLSQKTYSGGFTPSPYADLATSRAPKDLKRMFPLLEYYAKMDDVVSPIVQKASQYPIMPLEYSAIEEDRIRKVVKEIFEENLDVRNFLMEQNMDYNTYGNSFTSLSFPFKRWFKCRECKTKMYADFISSYRFKNWKFYFKCPQCGDKKRDKEYGDQYVLNKSGVNLIKWRPHDIDIIRHPYTGKSQFFYTPSKERRKELLTGNKFLLDGTPKMILEAIKKKKKIVFNDGDIFHMKRPGVSSQNQMSGWGMPLILPCIHPGYLKKVYMKASEVTGVIRSAPAHFIYPETNTGAGAHGQILQSHDVTLFQEHIRQELIKHRFDPGYVMTSPHPIGQQMLFGDAKQFNYYQEIKYQDEQILSALGYPRELLQGGLQFSSSSIALRILETQLLKVFHYNNSFLKWLFLKVSAKFSLGDNSVSMQKFKMADDIQMLQLQLQESREGDMSRKRIWEGALDIEWDEEQRMIGKEDEEKYSRLKRRAIADAEIQAAAQEIMMRSQAKQMVKSDVDRMKQQAVASKRDPSYAKRMQMEQQMVQQQGMMQQMEMMAKNQEMKQQQQDRLMADSDLEKNINEKEMDREARREEMQDKHIDRELEREDKAKDREAERQAKLEDRVMDKQIKMDQHDQQMRGQAKMMGIPDERGGMGENEIGAGMEGG